MKHRFAIESIILPSDRISLRLKTLLIREECLKLLINGHFIYSNTIAIIDWLI